MTKTCKKIKHTRRHRRNKRSSRRRHKGGGYFDSIFSKSEPTQTSDDSAPATEPKKGYFSWLSKDTSTVPDSVTTDPSTLQNSDSLKNAQGGKKRRRTHRRYNR